MFQKFLSWSHRDSEKERINAYLEESISLVDLEIRQRKIDRGEAPWQNRNRPIYSGWN